MARVFEVPRYKNQTLHRVQMFIDATYSVSVADRATTIEKYANREARAWKDTYIMLEDIDYDVFENDVIEFKDIAEHEDNIYDKHEEFVCKAAMELKNEKMKSMMKNSGTVFVDIFRNVRLVRSDNDAMNRIVAGYLSGDLVAKVPGRDMSMRKVSALQARDMMTFQILSSKLSSGVFKETVRNLEHPCKLGGLATQFYQNAEVFERLVLQGVSEENQAAHSSLCDADVNYQGFDDTNRFFGKNGGFDRSYRVMGIYILIKGDTAYTLDHSALVQVYQCLRFWSGSAHYFSKYRVSGNMGEKASGMFTAYTECVKWVSQALVEIGEKTAKHMKVSYALLQNLLNDSYEKLNMSAMDRHKNIMADLEGVATSGDSWFEFVTGLPIPDRAKMNIGYLFHGVPAPDCDAQLMFESVVTKSSATNPVDSSEFNRFMQYSKTFDLCSLLGKYGQDVVDKIKCVEGYEYEDEQWFNRCLAGRITMPNDADFGKAWVEGFFPFDAPMDTWFYEAADVTHVPSDLDKVTSVPSTMTQEDHNELLYALKNAPYLNDSMTPQAVRNSVCSGNMSWDAICVLASKSENTKFGAKIRETYSGSDCLREVTSEIDRTGIKAASLHSASVLRLPVNTMNRKLHLSSDHTSPRTAVKHVLLSLDVSGWSINADREKLLTHHAYASKLTVLPDGYDLKKVWKKIHIVIDKRGYTKQHKSDQGAFQGFTGTLDTVLHQHMIYYAIRKCKDSGILMQDEAAHAMVLIDDALVDIPFAESRTDDECQRAADLIHAKITSVYKSLGYIIDIDKTIYSTIKYTFLNRLFCLGTEVLTDMKVYSKIDREISQKFSCYRSQCSAIFTSASSAVSRGSDPYVSYHYALCRAFDLAFQTNKSLTSLNPDVFFHVVYAPACLGGFGFPNLMSFISHESNDAISTYIGDAQVIYKQLALAQPVIAEYWQTRVADILYQPWKEECGIDVLENPYIVKAKGAINAAGAMKTIVASKLQDYASSTIFRDALALYSSKAANDHIVNMVKTCEWDAAVLEEFMSCGASAAISSLVDKAISNEVLAFLMTAKQKSALGKRMRSDDARSLSVISGIKLGSSGRRVDLGGLGHYEIARVLREEYLTSIGLAIINHTRCDPMHSLVQAPPQSRSTISTKCVALKGIDKAGPTPGWYMSNTAYCNMYDNKAKEGSFHGSRSKGIIDTSNAGYRALNKIQRTIVKGVSVCSYISFKGGSGLTAWRMLNAMWGIADPDEPPLERRHVEADASTKRISTKLCSRTHDIHMFPNSLATVNVDTTAIGRYLSSMKVHADYMSYLIAVRASVLLDVAGLNAMVPERHFNMQLGSIPITEEGTCMVREDMGVDRDILIGRVAASVPALVGRNFRVNMINYLAAAPAEGDVVEMELVGLGDVRHIGYLDPQVGLMQIGQVAAQLGIVADSPIRIIKIVDHRPMKKKRANVDAAQPVPVQHAVAIERRVQEDAEVTPSAALISIMVGRARASAVRRIPDEAYLFNPRDAPAALFNSLFKDPAAAVSYVVNAFEHGKSALGVDDLLKFFPRMNAEMCNALIRVGRADPASANVQRGMIELYMCSIGRLYQAESYMAQAAYNPDYMLVAWEFAERRAALREDISRRAADRAGQTVSHFRKDLYKVIRLSIQNLRTINEVINMFNVSLSSSYASLYPEEDVMRLEHNVVGVGFESLAWHGPYVAYLGERFAETTLDPVWRETIIESVRLLLLDIRLYHGYTAPAAVNAPVVAPIGEVIQVPKDLASAEELQAVMEAEVVAQDDVDVELQELMLAVAYHKMVGDDELAARIKAGHEPPDLTLDMIEDMAEEDWKELYDSVEAAEAVVAVNRDDIGERGNPKKR